MTPATAIQNYLLLHLHREFPGLDVWRANVVGRKPGVSVVAAGEPGQADLTGVWGGRCSNCGTMSSMHTVGGGCSEVGGFIPQGRSVWIEVKAPGDSQSSIQRDFERRVIRLGALYAICKVRKRETVVDIMAYFKLPASLRMLTARPVEIAAFFEELRGKL